MARNEKVQLQKTFNYSNPLSSEPNIKVNYKSINLLLLISPALTGLLKYSLKKKLGSLVREKYEHAYCSPQGLES